MAALIILFFATGATLSGSTSAVSIETEPATETTVVQSYEPESQGECIVEPTVLETTKEITDVDSEDESIYIQYYTEQDAIDIAKVLYAKCRGVPSVTEQACVAWAILNRVDKYESTVYPVVRAPNQYAFRSGSPVNDDLLDLAYDVLDRWSREKNGETDVGRTLPPEYTFFEGDGNHNHFRDNYNGSYNIWDYSLESPYKS